MKTTILIIMILLTGLANSFGQENRPGFLVMKKIRTGEQVTIPEGKKIQVETIYGNIHKGNFRIYRGDSTTISRIIINKDTLRLNELFSINIKKSQEIGSVFLCGGLVITLLGVSSMPSQELKWYDVEGTFQAAGGLLLSSLGVIAAGVGLIILTSGSKTYKVSKWEFRILK